MKAFSQPMVLVALFSLAACSGGGTMNSSVPAGSQSLQATAQTAAQTQTRSALSKPAPAPNPDGTIVYNSIPTPLGPMPSEGFEATQTFEFGDGLNLTGTGTLDTVSVVMDSWACQTGDGGISPPNANACVTTPGSTFNVPITMNVYAVCPATSNCPNLGGRVGALLATQTQTFAIPYRPSAVPVTQCPANTGQFYSAIAAQDNPANHCVHGLVDVIVFDNLVPQPSAPANLPSQAIFTVAFNTTDYGPNPTHVPGPYDSLNVGVWGNGGPVGTVLDPNGVFQAADAAGIYPGDYCDGEVGGHGFLRLDTPCWTGFHPEIQVTVVSGKKDEHEKTPKHKDKD